MRQELLVRVKDFALRIVRLYVALPKRTECQVLGKQLLRSGTSVGAHYSEATRSRSKAEFVSKLEVALQELEATRYWLELLVAAEMVTAGRLQPLLKETAEIIAILTASTKTAKQASSR
jgi:four helix bundle protein